MNSSNSPDTSSAPQTPPRGGLFSWRTLRRVLITLAVLVTLFAAFLTVENWRGRRAWEACKADLKRRGEPLTYAEAKPPPVPADQNFCAVPMLADAIPSAAAVKAWTNRDEGFPAKSPVNIYAGLGPKTTTPKMGAWDKATPADLAGWQTFYAGNTNFPATPAGLDAPRAVLAALAKYDAVVHELRAASARPYAQAAVDYGSDPGRLMPYLATFKSTTQFFALRTAAELAAGQSDEALADLRVMFRLGEAMGGEPLLIAHLVRIAITAITVGSVWEGLAAQQWTDAQLVEIQAQLAATDLLQGTPRCAGYLMAMRGEQGFMLDQMETVFRFDTGGRQSDTGAIPWLRMVGLGPQGWFYQNKVAAIRIRGDLQSIVDAANHRVLVERCGRELDLPVMRTKSLYNIMARMLAPAVGRAATKSARGQASVDLALVACALERARLANGNYPASLDALVPKFLPKLPPDVVNGEPLHYRLQPDGRFLLYSVAVDLKDDGGKLIERKRTVEETVELGDWVWQYPAR